MYALIAVISIVILSIVFNILFKKNNISISNRLFTFFSKLLILAGGVILIYLNCVEFNQYQQRKIWEKTTGHVISFDIVGVKTREPEISYQFFANDSVYNGKTNLMTPLFGSRNYQEQTAQTISGNYQTGDSVMVYYNPDFPKESALKITPAWSTYIQFTFGIFIVSIIVALIIPVKL